MWRHPVKLIGQRSTEKNLNLQTLLTTSLLRMKEVALQSDVTAAVEQFTALSTKMEAVIASMPKSYSWLAGVARAAGEVRGVSADLLLLADAGIRLRCKPRSRTLTQVTCSAADITSAVTNVKTFVTPANAWACNPGEYCKFAMEFVEKLEEFV